VLGFNIDDVPVPPACHFFISSSRGIHNAMTTTATSERGRSIEKLRQRYKLKATKAVWQPILTAYDSYPGVKTS